MKYLWALLLAVSITAFSGAAQESESDRRANTPVETFKIIGSIYYVGAAAAQN